MTGPAAAIAVLADANILVKDVVSNVLYDLHASGQIQLHWTDEIEAEYIRHRARLRAQANARDLADADLAWASARIEVIKRRIVKRPEPPGWSAAGGAAGIAASGAFADLLGLPDPDDVHVAIAAAHLAAQMGRSVVLATENLADLPAALLLPRKVAAMHPGDLLELLHGRDPDALSASVLKTAGDFKNPAITPQQMLRSISSKNQFWNPELAGELAKAWGVSAETEQGARGRAAKDRGPSR